MQFFSTRDTNRKVTSSEAIAQGLSDEGGLFVPESFPQVDVRALCELDYPALAAAVIREYLTDYSPEFLAQAARTTYGEAFGGKAGYLAPVEGDTYALELWHGPTCAFKDYALQLMPRLLVEAKKNLGRTEKTLILVATSGDTGKAALDGYHDIPGVEIAVFYPTGGTNPDAADACKKYNEIIHSVGGIDLQLLGLGPNGHIGFNEPGEAFELETHCVNLTPATIEANKRFFDGNEDLVPKQAYTMGIKTIMQARKVLVVANGLAKAKAVKAVVSGPVTPECPGSILQMHPDCILVADEEALSLL